MEGCNSDSDYSWRVIKPREEISMNDNLTKLVTTFKVILFDIIHVGGYQTI